MDMISLQSLILLFSIFLIIYTFFFLHPTNPKPNSTTQTGFKHYPILGTLPEFFLNRHRFLDWSTRILSESPTNTAVFTRPGKTHGIITANPENIHHILKTNFHNYPKGATFIALLHDFLGRGIFNSDAETWSRQRKTASHHFNTRSLRSFVFTTATNELHTRLIPILENTAKSYHVIDLQDLLERYAFDSICKVAFDVDPGCLAGDGTTGGEFMKAFDEAATLSSGRFMYLFPGVYKIKKVLNIGSEAKLRKSIDIVHKYADDIIKLRMEERKEGNGEDLLSRFMGESEYSPEDLRDIVVSFILAGESEILILLKDPLIIIHLLK